MTSYAQKEALLIVTGSLSATKGADSNAAGTANGTAIHTRFSFLQIISVPAHVTAGVTHTITLREIHANDAISSHKTRAQSGAADGLSPEQRVLSVVRHGTASGVRARLVSRAPVTRDPTSHVSRATRGAWPKRPDNT